MDKLRSKLHPAIRKVVIGFAGWLVTLVGVVLIPYPGPGWLIVFVGLSILATEFVWARRVHGYARGKYDAWKVWMTRQPSYIQAVFWCLTALTVMVTLWLLNAYGCIDDWLHLRLPQAHSPILS